MTRVAQQSEPGRPVSRLVSPVIWRLAALVAALATVCVVGMLAAAHAVGDLTDDLAPTSRAHDQVGESLADVETNAAAWALTGDVQWRDALDQSAVAAEAAIADLRDLADADADLSAVLTTELDAARAWIDDYAGPVAAAPGGADTFDPELVTVGHQLWRTYGDARAAASDALERELERAGDAATVWIRLTIIAALLVTGLSWILIGRSRRRLLTELSEPLLALEQVVQRMLRNDPDGRAAAAGPQEVRSIARALNDFADAQSRARAVEGRIQDELHVLDSAKDDFVSNVSHELRTPLTTISGYLEMVADEFEGKLEPRHDRMLEATRRNVVRLRALIDDLLALSKAETRPDQLEPSDVTEMVTDAVTDVRISAARRGISVEVTATDEPMLVVCDRAMLYRAFLNVLTNAVKFSHDEDTVEVSVKRVQHHVEIAVRDHGIGIPRTELDRLGTRFFRASNAMTNEIAGTGLGLRIVQTIIDKHSGDVVIESAEGEGTTVVVRLRLHGERVGRLPSLAAPVRADETV